MNVREIVPDHRLDETLAFMKRLREGEEIRSFGKKACDYKIILVFQHWQFKPIRYNYQYD